ncbi:MAG: DUF302 domain-containing protein [Alphaproteobacteria bacterium]|nr:DUF302 domain-containing protein [Alphaproteobacteria bacterium]
MEMSIDVTLSGSMDEVIDRVTGVLKEEGFGILTRINVDTTLKTKIDVDFRPYVILGACNPKLAHQALVARPDVGLMLPCNVVVDQVAEGTCLVRFIDPAAMMSFGDLGNDEALVAIGAQAGAKIAKAAAALS